LKLTQRQTKAEKGAGRPLARGRGLKRQAHRDVLMDWNVARSHAGVD